MKKYKKGQSHIFWYVFLKRFNNARLKGSIPVQVEKLSVFAYNKSEKKSSNYYTLANETVVLLHVYGKKSTINSP